MNKIHILKTLIDLFFFFAAFAMVGIIIVLPMAWFTSDFDLPVKIRGQEISTMDTGAKILMTFAAAGAMCFVYGIYCLRQTVQHFIDRKIFDQKVIVNLNRIGIFIIASSLLTNIPLFIYNAVERAHVNFELGAGSFDSLILSICLGLFFMVLSEVFKKALQLKEENELTV